MRSWRCITTQSCTLAAWIALGVIGFARHWDPYPFILINLALSTRDREVWVCYPLGAESRLE